MRIDAHIHFWRPACGFDNKPIADHAAYRRDFLPDDIEDELARCGIDTVLLVQAAPQPQETAWMLELAHHHPVIAGVVGWVDLDSEPIDYAPLCAQRALVGIRAQLRRIADPAFVLRPQVLANLARALDAGLGVTLLAEQRHYEAAERALRELPAGPVTFNHLGMRFADVDVSPWRRLLQAIAGRPETFLQLSGLPFLHGERWREAPVRAILDEAYARVGPARLVFASDWPMLVRFASYTEWVRAVEALLDAHGASADERDAVFRANALSAHPRLRASLGTARNPSLQQQTENGR
jgi:L-fuconolactonase